MGIQKKFINTLLFLMIFSFLVAYLFNMSHASSDMKINDDGTMNGCLFDDKTKICPMTIAEHLSRLQGMFTAIPPKTDFLIVLFMLISAIGTLLIFKVKRRWLLLLFNRISHRWRFYLKQNPHLPLFNHLQEEFSQGILNPKIYDSAVL